MKKWCLLSLVLSFVVCGCREKEPEAPLPPLKKVEVPQGVAGFYSGRTPCDDCKIQMVRLVLDEQSSASAVRMTFRDTVQTDSLSGSYTMDSLHVMVSLDSGRVQWKFRRDRLGNLSLLNSAGTVYVDADGNRAELARIYRKTAAQADSSKTPSQEKP